MRSEIIKEMFRVKMILIIPSQTFSNNKQSPLLHRNSGHSVQFSISSLLSRQSGLPSHKKLRGILTRKKYHIEKANKQNNNLFDEILTIALSPYIGIYRMDM